MTTPYSKAATNPKEGNMAAPTTHYLVVDSDDPNQVLAWFPMTERDAKARATAMADDTGHRVLEGTYITGGGFVPQV